MYHLFVILCLAGSPCVDDSRLIVKSENTFETTTACQVYSDTTFIPNVKQGATTCQFLSTEASVHLPASSLIKNFSFAES